MDKLFDFTDKVAVITGGSRGLGRQMALALAERGAHIVIASRKLDACEEGWTLQANPCEVHQAL